MTGHRQGLLAVALAATMVLAGCAGPLAGADPERDWFRAVGDEAGIDYETSGSDTPLDGGAFAADFDEDGERDLLLTGGEAPTLYENDGGEFAPVSSFPSVDRDVKSALFFDHDNDGWEDLLLVPRAGEPVFLENDEGSYRRADVGLDVDLSSGIGAAAADYTGNGCPDLFVIQVGDWRDRLPARVNAEDPDPDNGNPNVLFRGDCGSFERATSAGISGEHWSQATSFADLTGDGRPDVHVGNDFGEDVVYVNEGDGTFDRRELPNSDRHAMASATADVDGDGTLEVFVTNVEFENESEVWEMQSGLGMTNRGNTLFDYEDGRFVDRASEYGIRRGGWGWAGTFADFDDDGDRDLVHTTKHYLAENDDHSYSPVDTTPSFWERTGDGFQRHNASRLGFEPSNGRGLVALDFDGDGDRDVLVADVDGTFGLYENTREGGRSVSVAVEPGPDQTALGATVLVTTAEGTTYRRTVTSGSNFLSQAPRVQHVGVGDAAVERVRVVWPDGHEVVVGDVSAGDSVAVAYDGAVEHRD
jgi:hypothetical protein